MPGGFPALFGKWPLPCDQNGPQRHRSRIDADRGEAGQHGGDEVDFAIQHHRNRHHADREDDRGDESAYQGKNDEELQSAAREEQQGERAVQGKMGASHGNRERQRRQANPNDHQQADQQAEQRDREQIVPPSGQRQR